MHDSDNINRHDSHSSAWEKDRLFLEDLKDVLAFLRMQETSYERRRIRKFEEQQRRTPNSNDGIALNLPPFHSAWRPIMVSWMYHVADTFRLMPIVVATGIYILDTCALDMCNPTSRELNQKELYPLMTMTALNMAVKCHETKMFPLDQLVKLLGAGGGSAADQGYTPDDVIAMERQLLHQCGWKIHCPTTHDFLLRFTTVLSAEYKASVTAFAVKHLKQSLMWEHILHKEKKEAGMFSSCTLAYAAFLFAMEDAGLPLANKQAACLAILEVANLSAQTPRLSEAYNWLFKAKSLQAQLEQGKNRPQSANSNTSNNDVPAHSSTEEVQDEIIADLLEDSFDDHMSCDTRQSQTAASSSDVAIVEPDTDDESGVEDDLSESMRSYGSSSISDHSVIFCSHSVDGDSVEVVALDNYMFEEDDEECNSMDHSAVMTLLPTVAEEEEEEQENPAVVAMDDIEEEEEDEPVRLVLSESLDEDGFEITFESKYISHLESLLASPREVSVHL